MVTPALIDRVFVPSVAGETALNELEEVDWTELSHAYGKGRAGEALHQDVFASLERLGDPDADAVYDALHALFSNVCHQGTIYEATPRAVPFIAAFAAAPTLWSGWAAQLAMLLGHIALASSFETEDAAFAGAHGEDVAETTRAAFVASREFLRAMAAAHPDTAELVASIEALTSTDPPSPAMIDRVAAAVEALDVGAPGDPPRPGPPDVRQPRVRHAKFGRGQVLLREPGKSRVRFDDGAERVILDRFLVPESD